MVLIVEDDEMFANTLKKVLVRAGLECSIAKTAEIALGLLKENPYDVCFLDWKMPGMGGEGFLEQYQDIQPQLKVVVLTGYPSGETMRFALRGELNAYAHDYLHKPVDNQELIRIAQNLTTTYNVDDFRLDTVSRKLYHSDQAIHLKPNEYEFTKFFMANVDKWFTYQEIVELVFDEKMSSQKATSRIKSQMSEYRKKLKIAAGYEVIHSSNITVESPVDGRSTKRPIFSFQRKKELIV